MKFNQTSIQQGYWIWKIKYDVIGPYEATILTNDKELSKFFLGILGSYGAWTLVSMDMITLSHITMMGDNLQSFLSRDIHCNLRLLTKLLSHGSASYCDTLLYAKLAIRWKDANGVMHLNSRLLELSRIESHILGLPHWYLGWRMRVHIPNVDTWGHDKISVTFMGREIYYPRITYYTLWLGIIYTFFLMFIPKQTIKTTSMCLLLRAFSEVQVGWVKTKVNESSSGKTCDSFLHVGVHA